MITSPDASTYPYLDGPWLRGTDREKEIYQKRAMRELAKRALTGYTSFCKHDCITEAALEKVHSVFRNAQIDHEKFLKPYQIKELEYFGLISRETVVKLQKYRAQIQSHQTYIEQSKKDLPTSAPGITKVMNGVIRKIKAQWAEHLESICLQ